MIQSVYENTNIVTNTGRKTTKIILTNSGV
jgi:hypothetical protein